jgi:predicted nucleic acid-binding protein
MLMSEIIWVSGRLFKHVPDSVFHDQLDELIVTLPWYLGDSFRFLPVDTNLATEAALYRLKYYSRKDPISYNDALLLAAALLKNADFLVTTDSHILKAKEDIKIVTPAKFVKSFKTPKK